MKIYFYNTTTTFDPKIHGIRTLFQMADPSSFLPGLNLEPNDHFMVLNNKGSGYEVFPFQKFEEYRSPRNVYVFKNDVIPDNTIKENSPTKIIIGKSGKFQKTFSFPPFLTYGHVICLLNVLLRKKKHTHPFSEYIVMMTTKEGNVLSPLSYSLSSSLPPLQEIKVFRVPKSPYPPKKTIEVEVNYTTGFQIIPEKEMDLFTNTFDHKQLLHSSFLLGNSTSIEQLIKTFCPYPYAAVFLDTELFGQTQYPCVFSINASDAPKYLSQTIGAYAKERLDINLLPFSWYCFCHKNIYKHKTCSSSSTPASSKLCVCCGLPFKKMNKRSFSSIDTKDQTCPQ